MPFERLVTIAAVTVSRGTCRYCGQGVLWATTASRPGYPSKTLPFNPPRPFPLSTRRNDETGVVFEDWPRAALHVITCKRQPARRSKAGASA